MSDLQKSKRFDLIDMFNDTRGIQKLMQLGDFLGIS